MLKKLVSVTTLSFSLIFSFGSSLATAGAIHDASLFTTNFPGNDDGSVGPVSLGMDLNFFGNNFSSAYVNNNGNITFTGALSTFTPFQITGGSLPMLAPFFADVDTRIGDTVKYGTGTINGRNVFGVNWIDVGYYSARTDLLNSFQLIIVDRSDTGAGNFDFEFNYDSIQWETGSASGGVNGFGGSPARAGWTNGAGTYEELTGSGVTTAFIDSNLNTGLVHNSRLSNIDGQYIYQVRNGVVVVDVPESSPMILMILGLFMLVVARRKTNR